jgi:hypothetical protein
MICDLETGICGVSREEVLEMIDFNQQKFSKEIEVMYDLEQSDINAFVEQELSPAQYHVKKILGESYFTLTVQ